MVVPSASDSGVPGEVAVGQGSSGEAFISGGRGRGNAPVSGSLGRASANTFVSGVRGRGNAPVSIGHGASGVGRGSAAEVCMPIPSGFAAGVAGRGNRRGPEVPLPVPNPAIGRFTDLTSS